MHILPNNGFQVIALGLLAWAMAQVVKGIIERIVYGEFSLERFLASGGMPSSHSSMVTCVTATIGKLCGFDSVIFALSMAFACVVMYDACHVRKASGEQAQVLNDLIRSLSQSDPNVSAMEELKVVMGHTFLQVLFGALLGFVVALLGWRVLC